MAFGPLSPKGILMTVLICGANGSIGTVIAREEAKNNTVVGTYRKHDDHAKELEKNPNIHLIQKDMFESTDMKDVVDRAREHGPIQKVYYLVGEGWNIRWDIVKLHDLQQGIKVCTEPLASLIIECKPELADESNLMRWVNVSGIAAMIYAGGPNKPASGGAKHLAEFYFRSASGFWTWKKNLFNNVRLGMSKRTKNFYAGYHGDKMKQIYKNDIPMGDGTNPEDVAKLLLWLNGDENRFMTGQDIVYDGGESIRTRDNIKDTPAEEHPKYY